MRRDIRTVRTPDEKVPNGGNANSEDPPALHRWRPKCRQTLPWDYFMLARDAGRMPRRATVSGKRATCTRTQRTDNLMPLGLSSQISGEEADYSRVEVTMKGGPVKSFGVRANLRSLFG